MIESGFHRVIRAESIGSSGYHSDLIVQTLDGTVGDFPLGPKPVEDEFLVRPQQARDVAHRFDAAAQGALGPDTQERPGPGQGAIAPEVLKGLLEHPSPAGGQLGAEQAPEFVFGVTPDAAAAPEQFPAHALELGGLRTALQAVAFGAAHLIEGVIEVGGDVEAIQDVQRLAHLGGDHAQVGFPHVTADELHSLDDLRSQDGQPATQRGLGSSRSDPEQAAAVGVDLVDDGQEIVRPQPLAPVDLVHPDGLHCLQDAVGQPPLDNPIHGPIDRFPTDAERPGRFPPRQALGPTRQEDHQRNTGRTLAFTPGEVLDPQAVLRTTHPARRIVQMGRNAPQGHEAPRAFRQPVVARSRLLALGTPALAGSVRLQVDVDAQRGTSSAKLDLTVNKAGETLNPVQNGLNMQLNSRSPGLGFAVFVQPQTTRTFRDQLFTSGPLDPRSHLPPTPHAAVPSSFRAARRHSPMGVEPLRAEAQRTFGRGPQRATGAPSGRCRRPSRDSQMNLLLPTNSATEPN